MPSNPRSLRAFEVAAPSGSVTPFFRWTSTVTRVMRARMGRARIKLDGALAGGNAATTLICPPAGCAGRDGDAEPGAGVLLGAPDAAGAPPRLCLRPPADDRSRLPVPDQAELHLHGTARDRDDRRPHRLVPRLPRLHPDHARGVAAAHHEVYHHGHAHPAPGRHPPP